MVWWVKWIVLFRVLESGKDRVMLSVIKSIGISSWFCLKWWCFYKIRVVNSIVGIIMIMLVLVN